MISSSVIYGRHAFIYPSTSPILIFSVTIAIISFGAMICANCAFVSIRSMNGSRSTTFFHGSRNSCIQVTIILSSIDNSISENSLFFSRGFPAPPSIRSRIAKPIFVESSRIISPAIGAKLIMPSTTGLLSAFVNSEKVTVSELATLTCTVFRR